MDAGCAPSGILSAHLADQVSDFVGDEGSSGPAAPHLPSPEQSKAGPMPGQDRFWFDYGQRRAPVSPEVNFGRFAADLWSTPIWWRSARFSSCTPARERKIEDRVARSDVRRISIAENYEARISLIRSDISRFSGGKYTPRSVKTRKPSEQCGRGTVLG